MEDNAQIAERLLAEIRKSDDAMRDIDELWYLIVDLFLNHSWNNGDAVAWVDERGDEHGGRYDSGDVDGMIGLLEATSNGR